MGISYSLPVEENKGSNAPETRMLANEFDPRSPSEGIIRTPIEVTCTPKGKVRNMVGTLSFDTPINNKSFVSPIPKRILQDSPNLLKSDKTSDMLEPALSHDSVADNSKNLLTKDATMEREDRTETEEIVMEVNESLESNVENESNSPRKQLDYLETDIDEVEILSKAPHIEHPRVRLLRNRKISTAGANESTNTSLTNETVNTDTLSARIDSLSFTDVSFDDPSLLVSDIEDEPNRNEKVCPTSAIKEWLITVESDGHNIIPFAIMGDAEEKITQKNCVTPDRKIKLTNERTPLGYLAQNQVHEPTNETSDSKKKQWRSIQDERMKRGLSAADENTPPALRQNPFDHTASAPGKLMRHRRAIDWDRSNVLRK